VTDALAPTLTFGSYRKVACAVEWVRVLFFLGCVLACSATYAHAQAPAIAPRRPNVLVILTDDQRWDALGVVQREQGSKALFPWLHTPNLDRLATEGARFRNAFVTTSLCSPSRASLLSGRYARRHKVLDNFTEYPNDLPGYPQRLKAAGYQTAYIGKWHMGEDNDAERPGFDHWMSHRGQGNYFDNEFNIDGTRRRIDGYYTTIVTDHAVDWIGRTRDTPWMLVVGHKAPHGGPIQPEPRFARSLDDFAIRTPVNYGNYRAADGKPSWLEQSLTTWHGAQGPLYDLKKHDAFVRAYLSTLMSVDDSVGRLYEALRASGQLDRTVIVFTSDNGFVLGEHGRVDKRTMYEESIRVPLIVRYPTIVAPGTVVDQMVISHDLAPSLVELGGAAALQEITGRSFVPLLTGRRANWRDAFLYEYNYEKQFPYTPNVRGVRTARWKYIRYPHGDGTPDRFTAELYDLQADPYEMRNLIDDPRYAGRRLEMQRLLERVSGEAGPDRMPIYDGIVNVRPVH
jgi:arylsulfatase A-like enzyme